MYLNCTFLALLIDKFASNAFGKLQTDLETNDSMAGLVVPRHSHQTPYDPRQIFLIESNPADVEKLREIITGISPHIQIVDAPSVDDACERLYGNHFDAILLSLSAISRVCEACT